MHEEMAHARNDIANASPALASFGAGAEPAPQPANVVKAPVWAPSAAD